MGRDRMKTLLFTGIPAVLLLACVIAAAGAFFPKDSGSAVTVDWDLDVNGDGSITGDELMAVSHEGLSNLVGAPANFEQSSQAQEAMKGGSGSYSSLNLFLRARVDYESEDGVTGLSDDMLRFDNTDWRKAEDGWYYYYRTVKGGETVPFITGAVMPKDWGPEMTGKKFALVVHVEASERFDSSEASKETKTETLEDGTTRTVYVTEHVIAGDDVLVMKEASGEKVFVRIKEYQKNADGTITDYVNDKTVNPGQWVSKIVEFETGALIVRSTGRGIRYLLYGAGLFLAAYLIVMNHVRAHRKKVFE